MNDSSLIKGQLRAGKQPGSLRAMSISATHTISINTWHYYIRAKHLDREAKSEGAGQRFLFGSTFIVQMISTGPQNHVYLNKNDPLS